MTEQMGRASVLTAWALDALYLYDIMQGQDGEENSETEHLE